MTQPRNVTVSWSGARSIRGRGASLSSTPMRTIRRSHRFESEAGAIEPNVKRWDQLLEAVEWLLANSAEAFRWCPTLTFVW